MRIDKSKLEELKAKNPDAYLLKAKGDVEIVVRPPNDAEWGAYQDDREKRGARALKGLVLSVILYPSADDFQLELDRKPGLANLFGGKVMEIAGLEEEAIAKKL